MALTEILPCPFCGKQPENFPSGDGTALMIHCITDGCVNPHVSYYPPEAAITVWNRRAALSEPKEQK